MKQQPANLLFVLVWVCLFVLLVYGFNRWHQHNQGGIAYQSTSSTSDTVVLKAGRDHHFRLKGKVNGVPVRFLVDTGASKVALPVTIAKKAGLKKQYPVTIKTADGLTTGYLTRIQTLTVGSIVLYNVSALIMNQKSGTVLLGMSALKKLELKQEEGTLSLRKKKNQ